MNNDQRGVGETHTNLAVRLNVVSPGTGGVYRPPGWKVGSSVKGVLAGTTDLMENVVESADGFTLSAGGGGAVTVLWIAAHPRGGSLQRK